MLLKLFGIVIALSQLDNLAHSCNAKLLDMEAETHRIKLWSKDSISDEDIKKSLIFLYEPNDVNKKYLNSEDFKAFYNNRITEMNKKEYINFAQICKKIYESIDADNNTKIAIHMLFERVSEKYSKDFKLRQKLKNFNSKKHSVKSKETDINEEKMLNIFMNADKNIGVR